MKFKTILLTAVTAALLVGLGACKSESEKSGVNVEDQNTELTAALQDHNIKRVSTIADSMAMYVDELSPDESITVLMAFLEIHNDAAAAKDRRRDLETIRKFVDVYDIASMVNPNDFKAAVAHARSINPAVNLAQIVEDFRDKLAEYEALNGEPEPAQETVTATDSTTVEEAAGDAPEIVKPDEEGDTPASTTAAQ